MQGFRQATGVQTGYMGSDRLHGFRQATGVHTGYRQAFGTGYMGSGLFLKLVF